MKDPKGKVRKIHYIPNTNGFGATAYVRVGLKKITQTCIRLKCCRKLSQTLRERGVEQVDELKNEAQETQGVNDD